MSTQANATFAVARWDEQTWDGQPAKDVTGMKFTRAQVGYAYKGDVVGVGTVEYLMFYDGSGATTFIGLEQIVGSLGGRSGNFVLQHNGVDAQDKTQISVTVVPGSGTDELHGLRGTGSFTIARHQERYDFSLEYDFE